MADVYIRESGDIFYYCNVKKNNNYTLRSGGEDCINKRAVIELTDGKFVFPANSRNFFLQAKNTTFNDMDKWDTSEVTDMNNMFSFCSNLTSLDLSHFDTSNVTDMYRFIYGCISLTGTLDVSTLDTSKVTNFSQALGGNYLLNEIKGLNNLDLSNCTNFEGVFSADKFLKEIDISKWDTSKGYYMGTMFSECESVKKILLGPKFSLEACYTANSMFYGCLELEEILVPEGTDWVNYSITTNTDRMFINCTKLPNWDETTDITRANTNWYFGILQNWVHYDTYVKEDNSWKEVEKVYTSYSERGYIDPPKQVVPLANVYYKVDGDNIYYCNEQKEDYLPIVNSELTSLISHKKVIIELTDDKFILPEDSSYLFSTASNSSYNDTDKWVTSNVKNFNFIFDRNDRIYSLDFVENWDVSNALFMQGMFYGVEFVSSLNLQNWDTYKVTNMYAMFKYMIRLETLDISNFYTYNVTNMYSMFNMDIVNDAKLKTIYASENFVTDNVSNYNTMFSKCVSLVGGAGTEYATGHTNGVYARIDNPPDTPGYFTYKAPKYKWVEVDLTSKDIIR